MESKNFSYDIEKSKKDNRSTVCLFTSHGIYNLIRVFTSTFLTAYIYSLTEGVYSYIWNVGVFNMVAYAVMFLTCFLFAYLVDKSNRIIYYQLACLLNMIEVVLLVFFGEKLAHFIVLAGVLQGLLWGLYYASYNVLKQEMVSRKSMKTFTVVYHISTKLINILAPILLGALIDISTYTQVAVYVVVIALFEIAVSFGVKSKRPENSSFSLKNYLKRLKNDEKFLPKMKFTYFLSFMFGFSAVLDTVVKVCIVLQFGSNFSLGTITSIISILCMIVIFLFDRFTHYGRRSPVYYIMFAVPIIGSLVFAFFPNMVTVIIFSVATNLTEAIYSAQYDIIRNRNMKENGYYDDISEHQTLVEMIMAVARVLAYGALVLVSLLKNYYAFYALLFVITFIFAMGSILVMLYEKRFAQPEQSSNTPPQTISTNPQSPQGQ